MSYQVLARKYRPKNFDTLVGQEHVVRALSHALRTGRLHHAYLFTGTRGVGKTTLSRILAKSLNCIGPDGQGGITEQPCGVCEACVAIDAGRFVDYIEMDAASNRGVDEMAQLLEQAVYAPSNARFKVYMIDEVHMLTNHAFNSMLKTLEEPPPHVKFILATTDPQKIPVTVLSRCLQFNLKQMPPGHIVGHLEDILGQEGVTFEQPALRLLAQGAHGSMRDALSLTDQAIAYAAGQVTLESVQGMLGALDQSYLVRLLDALAAQDGADLMAVADEMASRSLSYNGALQDLGTLLHRIALAQSVPGAVPQDLPELADIMRLAGLFEPQEVQLYYQIAVHGRNEIGLAPDEYAGFTMTLLRMLAFRPGQGGAEVQAPPAAAPINVPGARAAAAAAASHAAVTPRAAASAAASAAPSTNAPAAATPPAPAPRPAVPAPAPPPPMPAAPTGASAPGAPPMTSARAAINAALEAARAGAGMRSSGNKRPESAPAPAADPAPPPPPPRPSAPAAPGPGATMHAGSSASSAPQGRSAPPWDGGGQQAVAQSVAPAQAQAIAPPQPALRSQQPPDDDVPSWVTEFSDDTAVATVTTEAAPAVVVAPAPAAAVRAPRVAPHAYVVTPVPEIDWDGNWPALAGSLPLRGVAQQLALQTELVACEARDNAVTFRLRVPVDTLRASGNSEKLAAALQEHFPNLRVCVESDIGPVWYTAGAEQKAAREARQREAEALVAADPFVQELEQRFDAFVVPGSVKIA
ncbi:DNA polymerase-3 subunit gamma/tau [Massilia aurea]|uniref:DNA polymerase III subunit gamma/tau n=1 Tax=Massilia aurea TaxID=373040 RepID=A0A7W9U6B8_9BURK|nr:DNA polymerase III subunit gamma/tau [Massilia aurea]MBB6132410.1 DNA polymerase-3 subunit gamma/tau [Massilia aurea]